ncbi:MAG: extracellular solute-binding protein [Anaerolineales bacterium]|nr:extracellular solute-binding protein [Anaerolineales bacterium]
MDRRLFFYVLLIVALLLTASGCQQATPEPEEAAPVEEEAPAQEEAAPEEAAPVEPAEEEVDPMAALLEAALAEGEIVSYGLPDDWVNYGGMWELFESLYGIPHLDTDMGSGEIIAALQAEAGAGVADITDLGVNFAAQVVEEGLSQPYKHAYWDELPEYARDADGYWSAAYWGAIGICVNTDLVENVPTSWADLLDPQYQGMVSMKDPRSSGTANSVVLAAAFGNGGDETNVQPGLDYFAQMIEMGQLNAVSPSTSAIQAGEAPIALFWDFDCLSKADELGMPLQLVIPSDGTVAGLYTQFVTADAPHPNAAKLLLELEFSDEGQLAYAQGFTHPIRDIELPAELAAKFPPAEAYESVSFPQNFGLLTAAAEAIAEGWEGIAQ